MRGKHSKNNDGDGTGSYVPAIPWREHLVEIAHRYPYTFPPAITRGPHPIIGKRVENGKEIILRVPGGLPVKTR